ncbi:TVP38/TMEM64 family protein [Clostridioides sp. ES-S-0190-01]|nr:TVP38/TMEM64 family protein [Clostridioides sp. ES-S-0190-01]MCC0763950.1 TVP38/TMEM64 family protein [Clostridioides sp. ES-S-0006-03]UDN60317.1 TVP38/TMEM64 family protein [Clostridioides sp. ES-W-0016-02]
MIFIIKRNLKGIVTALIIVIFILIYYAFFRGITAEQIRQYVQSYGNYAPFVYILIFSILPITFFPVPVLALAGGLAFGLWKGTLYTIIGAGVNSAIMFMMAKVLAKDAITKFLKNRLSPSLWKLFMEADEKRGFFIIFVLRLIPITPYNLINYGAGLTNIRFSSYMFATLIGILPGTLVFLNIGDKAIDITNPSFIISIVLLFLLIITSLILAKKISPTSISKRE